MAEPGFEWQPWEGGRTRDDRPVRGTTMVKVRIRCRTRADAEDQLARPASSWNWQTKGPDDPGAILEFRRVKS